MNRHNLYRQYQQDTAGPEEAVVLLYDGARRFTDQALAALTSENAEEMSQLTGKAQRILSELTNCLNHEAGEIAGNLAKLYEYWIWRLSQGLVKRDPAAYQEVSAALVDMREAWAEAARQVRAQRAGVTQHA